MTRNVSATTVAALARLMETARRELLSMQPKLVPAQEQARANAVFMAAKLCEARRLCRAHFDSDGLPEGVFDLLLELYVAPHEGRPVTITAASKSAGAAYATAYRWVGVLERQGHVVRTRHDGRTIHLELTPEATDRMTAVLLSLSGLFGGASAPRGSAQRPYLC
jgi:DNA-binding MarR family transcriptional regulator